MPLIGALQEGEVVHLAVFGASGPTGRKVVEQALAAGHHVRAATRRPEQFPLSSPRLDVVGADVTDPGAVERVVAGTHAVVSTFGVPYSRHEVTVYSRGTAAITRAMQQHGVERLVCVSSTTVATGAAPGESLLWRRAVVPLLRRVVGRTVYDDMERMEALVRGSGLEWTVVRPGGLFDAEEPTDDFLVSTQRLTGRSTSRADLAAVLVREATDPQHPRSVVEVITRSGLPSPLRTVLKEAFGIGA